MSIYGYAIVMHKPVQFETIANYPDDRAGMWYADISVSPIDIDGNIDHDKGTFGVSHTGLWETEKQCSNCLIDKAYTMQSTLKAIGKRAWVHYSWKPNRWVSDEYLAYYIQERREKIERKAEAKRLREQAALLILQAKELTA
jgi:hypothetical protein